MDAPVAAHAADRVWPAVLVLFLLGLAVRALLVWASPPAPPLYPVHESINIAVSLVRHGTFADPFMATGPTGPTAHCLPLYVLLIAPIIGFLGTGPAACFALRCLGSAAISLGFALLPLLGRSCSLDRRVGISAGACGSLLPLYFWQPALNNLEFSSHTIGWWEAPFTLLTLIWLTAVAAQHWQSAEFTVKSGGHFGIVAAVATLFCANTIPIVGSWFVCALIWFSGKRFAVARYFATACLIVLAALAPWAIRNRVALGSWVLLRSNFGLELQVSNNSTSTSDADFNLNQATWHEQHPSSSSEERQKVLRMGEVAYDQAKKQEALGWIRSHPQQFIKLTAGRIARFWFPRMGSRRYTIPLGAMTALAILGVIRLWYAKPEIALLLGSACVAYSLIYTVIEVSIRYRVPLEGLLLFLGAYAVQSAFPRRYARGAAILEAQGRAAHPS
ncbi:MAG: hypothetical protein ACRD3S_01555 [Terracidiphilus sp.]